MSAKNIITIILCIAMAVWAYLSFDMISSLSTDIENMTDYAATADPASASSTYESIRSAQDARQQAILLLVGSFVVFLAALFLIRRMGNKADPQD